MINIIPRYVTYLITLKKIIVHSCRIFEILRNLIILLIISSVYLINTMSSRFFYNLLYWKMSHSSTSLIALLRYAFMSLLISFWYSHFYYLSYLTLFLDIRCEFTLPLVGTASKLLFYAFWHIHCSIIRHFLWLTHWFNVL